MIISLLLLVGNLCLEFSFAQVRQFVSMVLCEQGREHKKRRNRAINEVKMCWFLNQNVVDLMATVVFFFFFRLCVAIHRQLFDISRNLKPCSIPVCFSLNKLLTFSSFGKLLLMVRRT